MFNFFSFEKILSTIKPNGVDRQRDPNVDKCTEYQNTIMQGNNVVSYEQKHACS